MVIRAKENMVSVKIVLSVFVPIELTSMMFDLDFIKLACATVRIRNNSRSTASLHSEM